jgi:hypothetical protein
MQTGHRYLELPFSLRNHTDILKIQGVGSISVMSVGNEKNAQVSRHAIIKCSFCTEYVKVPLENIVRDVCPNIFVSCLM